MLPAPTETDAGSVTGTGNGGSEDAIGGYCALFSDFWWCVDSSCSASSRASNFLGFMTAQGDRGECAAQRVHIIIWYLRTRLAGRSGSLSWRSEKIRPPSVCSQTGRSAPRVAWVLVSSIRLRLFLLMGFMPRPPTLFMPTVMGGIAFATAALGGGGVGAAAVVGTGAGEGVVTTGAACDAALVAADDAVVGSPDSGAPLCTPGGAACVVASSGIW